MNRYAPVFRAKIPKMSRYKAQLQRYCSILIPNLNYFSARKPRIRGRSVHMVRENLEIEVKRR